MILIYSKNSWTVTILNLLSVVVLLLFNLSSMRVTLVRVEMNSDNIQYTNSVIRNLLEPIRTFLVWATAVFIHYFISDKYKFEVIKNNHQIW